MSEPRKVLLKFTHGIGDAAQFTVVLKHLRKYRPNWSVDVVAGRGKHTAFRGLCHATYFDGQPRPDESTYAEAKWVGWYENYNGYKDRPNSKITNCLAEEFGIPYDAALGRYEIHYSPADRERAREWLAAVGCKQREDGRFLAVGLHYEGNTSTDKKNLQHHNARAVCDAVASLGAKVILFDWDKRSPLPNSTTVINPGVGAGDLWGNFGSGDASMIAALVDQLAGFIGIDSGPGKIATATDTPTCIVWTKHNPLQFHDPAPYVWHLVPHGFDGTAPISGDYERLAYFNKNYRYDTYRPNQFGLELCAAARAFLVGHKGAREMNSEGLIRHGAFWVRPDNFDQDLVIIQDVYYGDCYHTSLYDLTQWATVVDVGGHIGTFPTLVHNRNPACKIVTVEACPENHAALKANVGGFAHVVAGAMTYEPGDLALLNAVRPGCESTGGSVVVRREELADPNHPLRQHGYQYWDDLRPLRKVSLGEVMREAGITHVDCLKLDCEGAELSILANAPEVARHVRFIFGEYHDKPRWEELRTRLFADWSYGKIYEADGRGIFHMINPNFDPTAPLPPLPVAQISEPVLSAFPEPIIPLWLGDVNSEMHVALAALVRARFGKDGKPNIVETGVKCGFSALTYFEACPKARVIGYDNFCDPTGAADLASTLTRLGTRIGDGSFTLVKADTKTVGNFPVCDLAFIDGDHTFAGCYFDLVKAANATTLVVVDDYYPDVPAQPVTNAVNWFVIQSPFAWKFTVVKVGSDGRHLAVLDRSGGPTIPEFGAPWGGYLKIACVAGVGDTAWIATKLPAIVKKLGAAGVDLVTCESARAKDYLAKLPFVRRTDATALRITEKPLVLPSGAYNYAPSQPGWHNHFHLFLQANGHLEEGKRLEEWLVNLPTDFAAPVDFTDTEEDANFADEFAAKGDFVTIFAGPLDGNTAAGHNVGGVWTAGDWAHVAHSLTSEGYRVVVVGYGPGDSDYNMSKLYPAGFYDYGAEDCVGLWELPRTLAILRRSCGHVGYQSGLGVLSVYLGKPAVMFWNRYGVKLNEHGATFREEMATAWVPPAVLKSGRYLGAIYGRTDAPTVASFIVNQVEKGSK